MRHELVRPTMGQIIRSAAPTAAGATRPHGVKVMGDGEDTLWADEEGVEHSVRAIPPLLDTLARQLEDGLATSSRMNTVSTSAPSAVDYPEGAVWTRVELVAGDLVERERWVLQGGAWAPVGLDASRLVAGTVDAGLIDTVALAARLITSGMLRTAATGQRLELTSAGLVLWLVDTDGVEYQAVQLGPQGANLLTVGDVTIAPRSVTAPEGSFETLGIAGQPAADYVDGRARAATARLVAIGGAGRASGGLIGIDANQTVGIFDVIVPVVKPDSWYRAEVELVTYPRGTDAEIVTYLRASRKDQGVSNGSPLVTAREHAGVVSGTKWDQKHITLWFKGSQMTAVPAGTDARLLLTVFSNTRVDVHAETTMAVYCEESAIPLTSTINRAGAPSVGSTGPTPVVTAPTQVQSYVKTYDATRSETRYDSDGRIDSNASTVVQGSYTGSAAQTRHGLWYFPDMTGDLSGATITNVEIYVKNVTTWADAGGKGHFFAHNGTDSRGGNIMNADFTRGQDRWLPIPSVYWDAFKNGSAKGFMAAATTNGTSDYAKWAAGTGSAKIRISYQK